MTHFRVPAAALLLLAMGAFIAASCSGGSDPPDLAGRVPEEAGWAVYIPPLEVVHPQISPFTRSLGGQDAFSDWLDAHTGIAIGSPARLAASGVHPGGALVAFGWGRLGMLAIPTASESSLEETLRARRLARGESDDERAQAADGMAWAHGDGFTVIGWGPSDGLMDALEQVVNAPPRDSPFGSSGRESVAGFLRLDTDLLAGGVDAMTRSLGTAGPFVGGMFNGWLRGLGRVEFTLNFSGGDVALEATIGKREERALVYASSRRASDLLPFLPSNAGVVVRAQLDVAALQKDLGWIFQRVGSPAIRHPMLSFGSLDLAKDVLPALRGDVAMAVLGIRAGASALAPIRAPTLQAKLSSLDWIVIVGLEDPARQGRWISRVLAEGVPDAGLDEGGMGCTVSELSPWTDGAPLMRWVCREGAPLILGVIGDALVVWGGDAALAATRDVQAGRLKSLDARVRGETSRRVLGASPQVGGIHASFTRLALDLAERGVPPYQLRVLGRVQGIGVRITADEGPVRVRGEVVQ
jgi:hypothetical protein